MTNDPNNNGNLGTPALAPIKRKQEDPALTETDQFHLIPLLQPLHTNTKTHHRQDLPLFSAIKVTDNEAHQGTEITNPHTDVLPPHINHQKYNLAAVHHQDSQTTEIALQTDATTDITIVTVVIDTTTVTDTVIAETETKTSDHNAQEAEHPTEDVTDIIHQVPQDEPNTITIETDTTMTVQTHRQTDTTDPAHKVETVREINNINIVTSDINNYQLTNLKNPSSSTSTSQKLKI